MRRTPRAPLIAIEGIDGTGKTTLQRALARDWRALGLQVREFQEPSRTPSGRKARRVSGGDPWIAALAFTEDRRRARPRIERALAGGTVVLLDRSFYSTLAYQGSALPAARQKELERRQRAAARRPDRVVLLDLSVRRSEGRRQRRGSVPAPTEHRAVLRRAARAYRALARRGGWIVLDARQSRRQIVARLHRRLTPWVLRRLGRERART